MAVAKLNVFDTINYVFLPFGRNQYMDGCKILTLE